MPNWVKNKVKFGDKKVILDCYKKEFNEDWGEENEIFDFNKIIPMPKSLHLTSGGYEDTSIAYALSKMSEEKRTETIEKLKEKGYENFTKDRGYTTEDYEEVKKWLKEKINREKPDPFDNVDYKGLKIKNLKDLGNTYIKNILEYGCDTWYDWSCKNWGTKWNACHVYYVDEYNIEFDTAWSLPYKIFKEISKKYNTSVRVKYADEDIGTNCGIVKFNGGKEKYYVEGDRQFALDIWDFDETDFDEEGDE